MKFIKGRWFPLIAASVVVAVIVCVMILCGWRFTYAPELGNNWDAVSGVSGWFGVVASFMAILYAVRVADKQNQIALFEKKYELFEIVFNCKIFLDSIKDVKNNIDVRMTFLVALCYNSIDCNEITDNTFVFVKQIAVLQKLKQIPFLYENTDVLDRLPKLIDTLTELMTGCRDDKNQQDLRERIQKFSDYIDSDGYKKLVEAMQEELMLN